MARKCFIPGFDDAIAEERRLREEIYLELPHEICGIRINHITPKLLARLNQISSPFLVGGRLEDGDIIQFLWALSVDFSTDFTKRHAFIAQVVSDLSDRMDEAEGEIDEFVDATFLDAPQGGSDETPYASSMAWIDYSMSKEPFGWKWEYTRDVPLRRIYQLCRCRSLDKGATLVNAKSDKVKGEWLADLQAHLETLPLKERSEFVAQLNRRNN